jgi:hypothetical protein
MADSSSPVPTTAGLDEFSCARVNHVSDRRVSSAPHSAVDVGARFGDGRAAPRRRLRMRHRGRWRRREGGCLRLTTCRGHAWTRRSIEVETGPSRGGHGYIDALNALLPTQTILFASVTISDTDTTTMWYAACQQWCRSRRPPDSTGCCLLAMSR